MQRQDPSVERFMRAPADVMRLARLGSAHPTRLSFLRILLRRVRREGWLFSRPLWQMDDRGVGRAVYRAKGPLRTYSLVAFAHDLPDRLRTDRVIATAWDATFALFDGEPTSADLDRLAANVPLQEAGRISARELSLSRANRSVRLFTHVVDCLSDGRQPELARLDEVGYLMRTTAVYGSGKFGAIDWERIAERPEFKAPFQAEMLSVWLIRDFSFDLVEHLARVRGGDRAAPLALPIRRRLGVGNATGLGMAPFLVKHPMLLNNWIAARETALARVRSLPAAEPEHVAVFCQAIAKAQENAALWRSDHEIQQKKLADLRGDLDRIAAWAQEWPKAASASGSRPWNDFWLNGAARLTLEGQEALVSLLLEPHAALVDDLADCMAADETSLSRIDGAVSLGAFKASLTQNYGWALDIDFSQKANQAHFWYVSEEKLEPRLGDRFAEPGAELEQPLDIARKAVELSCALDGLPDDRCLADFLLQNPQHRFMVRRVQMTQTAPYGEIQDNLIAANILPIDIMRCKLAFFGASRFDPRSTKWVRISLFQNEPSPFDPAQENAP